MSTSVLILGESGTGKSRSMLNLDPANTLLIQAISKPLPFKNANWKRFSKETKEGNIFCSDNATEIVAVMQQTRRKIIVIDDFQYILSNELMRRFRERGYDKFTETGFNGWNICNVAAALPADVRVYITAHTMQDEDGITKIKTPGKLLSTYSVEGLFSIVLKTMVLHGEPEDKKYWFATRNNGRDTVKTPEGLFAEDMIPNDLAVVDKAVCEYWT